MNRKSLLDVLELVKPALSDDNLVPVFTNFCFDAGSVYAYKDRIGIIAPCEVEDTFAVHGKTFMELLRASSAKEVELELDTENVLLKSGKSKMKVPFLGKDEFLFEEPENETWDIILDIDAHLLSGMELCLMTSSTDNTMPAFMGVTVKGGKLTHLYSCDGDALSRYQLDGFATKDEQYTIPNDFCESVIRIADKTGYKAGQLYVNGEWAVAEMGNNFKVFGRIIDNPEPLDFEAQIKRVLKGTPTYVEVPSALDSALNRARVVADPESKATMLKVEGGKLTVTTETHIGNVKDTMKIDKSHPDVEASVSAKLIHRAVSTVNEFALLENCTVYRQGDDFMLLVANYAE